MSGKSSIQRRRPIAGDAPFSGFLERDQERGARRQKRRRTVVISVAVHVFALAAVLVYSLWDVDELWGPSVGVKMFTPDKAPPAAHANPSR